MRRAIFLLCILSMLCGLRLPGRAFLAAGLLLIGAILLGGTLLLLLVQLRLVILFVFGALRLSIDPA